MRQTFAVLVLLVAAGCASLQKNTYTAVNGTQITVEVAMTTWGAYVAASHPTAAQEQMVKTGYERYQAAALLVIDAAQAFAANGNPTSQATMATYATQASTALADLINVMRSFGVKL